MTRSKRLAAVGLVASLLILAGGIAAQAAGVRCFGMLATITGTNAANDLPGTDESDTVRSLAGDDTIDALDGADRICAGAGNDGATGSGGDDRLAGSNGDDRLFGDRALAVETPGEQPSGDDTLFGQNGNDFLVGGAGDDTIRGGPGDDVIDALTEDPEARSGADTVNGDAGDDLIVEDDGEVDTIDGGEGGETDGDRCRVDRAGVNSNVTDLFTNCEIVLPPT